MDDGSHVYLINSVPHSAIAFRDAKHVYNMWTGGVKMFRRDYVECRLKEKNPIFIYFFARVLSIISKTVLLR